MRFRSTLGFFLGPLLLVGPVEALTPNEWKQSQAIEVPAAGLIRLKLPPETIDAARPVLEDLRIIDNAGAEVPYLVDRPMPHVVSMVRPKELRTELEPRTTRIILATGTNLLIKAVEFETPSAEFLKAVQVEGSQDGTKWNELTGSQPIFRMTGGASNLRVAFPEGAWNFLRLSINDSRTAAVPFTGVQLEVTEPNAPPDVFNVSIKSCDESFGKTRLALDLGASKLNVAVLRIEAQDPLFTRAVTIAVPNLDNDTIREQTLSTGSIYRIELNGKVESRLEVPINAQIRSRQLIVLIDNGDSPPLAIKSIEGERRMPTLVFLARETSRYTLLSGNNQCAAPRYDLAGLTEQLKTATAKELTPLSLVANGDYKAPDNLAAVPLQGAKINVTGWKFRRAIAVKQSGAQQVELDPDVLAHAASDLRDLRVVTEDRQLPYLLERTSISRSIQLETKLVNDPEKPRVSRWSLKLPQPGIPITRVTCTPASGLFERDMRLQEEVSTERGDTYPRELGRAKWQQLPNQPTKELSIRLDATPESDTLFLETDNGDNPAINLQNFQAAYPVTRVIFRTGASNEPTWLYYGNPEADAPHYDVSLIADQLLRAERVTPMLQPERSTDSTTARITQTLTGSARYIFWGVLAVVVIGLLLLISRLLPKTQ